MKMLKRSSDMVSAEKRAKNPSTFDAIIMKFARVKVRLHARARTFSCAGWRGPLCCLAAR